MNILPFESSRVPLHSIRGCEGSDFINASFIDGYRHRNAYIATQGTSDYCQGFLVWGFFFVILGDGSAQGPQTVFDISIDTSYFANSGYLRSRLEHQSIATKILAS